MSEWKKAIKRPVIIEYREVEGNMETVYTREGHIRAYKDRDFIIKGVEGELYPIKKNIFFRTYELI